MGLSYYFAKLMKKIQLPAIRDSEIHRTARVGSGSNILKSKMGRYSYIGSYCTAAYCEIGSFCSVSDNCSIGGASHPLEWASTSPAMSAGKNILNANFSDLPYDAYQTTVIGHDVWIGQGCYIKSGVRLSTGCVIGMGSVVTKDVGPYEIWAGNPAKLIRKRFDDETVEALLESKWWELSDEDLRKAAPYADRPALFSQKAVKG